MRRMYEQVSEHNVYRWGATLIGQLADLRLADHAPSNGNLERAPALRPGMYGRVQIDGATTNLTLPTDAILIKDGKESFVYIEKDPLTFVRRPVVVAQHSEDGRVRIVSGISPGDKVVVRGALLLDGSADQLL